MNLFRYIILIFSRISSQVVHTNVLYVRMCVGANIPYTTICEWRREIRRNLTEIRPVYIMQWWLLVRKKRTICAANAEVDPSRALNVYCSSGWKFATVFLFTFFWLFVVASFATHCVFEWLLLLSSTYWWCICVVWHGCFRFYVGGICISTIAEDIHGFSFSIINLMKYFH